MREAIFGPLAPVKPLHPIVTMGIRKKTLQINHIGFLTHRITDNKIIAVLYTCFVVTDSEMGTDTRTRVSL
jgi:hypothetical protein